jgi:uncharacterized protein YndB with AHSA1/START domain
MSECGFATPKKQDWQVKAGVRTMSATPAAKRQFTVTRDVRASAERVFEALVTPDGMKVWALGCRSASWEHPAGAGGPAEGSVRIFGLGGSDVRERIVHWDANRQLNYRIEPPSAFEKIATNYEGVTAVTPTGPSSCRLTWSAHYDTPGMQAVVAPVVRLGLRVLIGAMAKRLAKLAESS